MATSSGANAGQPPRPQGTSPHGEDVLEQFLEVLLQWSPDNPGHEHDSHAVSVSSSTPRDDGLDYSAPHPGHGFLVACRILLDDLGAALGSVRFCEAAWMMLIQIARDGVDLVAEKMETMTEEQLEHIKIELVLMLLGTKLGNLHRHNELLPLQDLVQGRVDLTPASLSVAHRLQLQVLFAIKTGSHVIMDPSVDMPQSHLIEVLLDKRCPNMTCLTPLPDCECHICANNNRWCRRCICMTCSNFDFEGSISCHRMYCQFCFHWAHTDCAVSGGQIVAGHGMVLFRCHACQYESKLFALVRKTLKEGISSSQWPKDDFIRQLGFVCKIFHLSDDLGEREFSSKCAELIVSLSSGSESDDSMYRGMLLQKIQEMDDHEALQRILTDATAEPIELSYAFLENITNGFSQEIGSGGFGVVYMGVSQNKGVAVKKLKQTESFSDNQFEDEFECLRRVKHENIVRFLGYCSHTEKVPVPYKGRIVLAEDRRRFLCFEYVPNKSLRDYLKAESRGYEWDTQYKLIGGICRGLCYLHNKERITHLDLKPENILMDVDMVPKITDFGLSRRFSRAQSRIITDNIRASRGYVAPEYWSKGEISFKADIFSLGIIIREILCRSIHSSDFENWYQSLNIVSLQVKRCIKISQLCVDDDPRVFGIRH